MPNTPLIALRNAGVEQHGRWLVRGVDLTVQAGEIVTLIGPNGSGKSTTAKMALGIQRPTEGEATRRSKLIVGYVPQQLRIDWTLPLDVTHLMQLTGPIAKHTLDQAMDRAGVRHLKHAEVRNLSGGEFQRVLLARAMARKPDLLVLDEPVQGVDYTGEIALYRLISEIRDELQCGVLMISHDLHVVMAATDQVICLNGHVCCSGTPTSVAESAEFQTLFGLRADTNLAVYTHHHDHEHSADGQVHTHHAGCRHDG